MFSQIALLIQRDAREADAMPGLKLPIINLLNVKMYFLL